MTTPVKFEIAKLLKEKKFGLSDEDYIQLPRFYEKCGNYTEYNVYVSKKYNSSPNHLGADTIKDFEAHLTMMDNSLDNIYLAPTIAEVVMWVYDKYKYSIEHSMDIPEFGELDGYYVFKGVIKSSENYKLKIVFISDNLPTITKAYEAAIFYCLTKLI